MTLYASLLYTLFALVATLLIAYLCYRIALWVTRQFLQFGFVHQNRSVQLVAFALALLLFPTFILDLFSYASSLLAAFLVYAPDALLRPRSAFDDVCSDASLSQCLVNTSASILSFIFGLLSAVTSSSTRILGSVSNSFAELLKEAIFVLAAWIVIAHIIIIIFAVEPMSENAKQLRILLNNVRKSTIKNLLLFSILIIASYLSFASIAAIPSLAREDIPPDVSHEELSKLLKTSSGALTMLIESKTPAAQLSTTLDVAVLERVANSRGISENDFQVSKTEALAKESELLSRLDNLKIHIKGLSESLLDIAVSTFRTSSLKRVGARATIDHYQAIHSWFEKQTKELADILGQCTSAIYSYQRSVPTDLTQNKEKSMAFSGSSGIKFSTQLAEQSLRSAVRAFNLTREEANSSIANRVSPGVIYEFGRSSSTYDEAVDSCDLRYEQSAPPLRGDLRNYVGSFGIAISWLLSSESQPLVLIVGLVGFGLLGAACSTFVREGAKKPIDGALVEDLAGVVIRGVSAAVVVFLAVYGGLGIFSSSGADPNPYVVLFTCLVGAVFSEVVWNWAQVKITSDFSETSTEKAMTVAVAEDDKGSVKVAAGVEK